MKYIMYLLFLDCIWRNVRIDKKIYKNNMVYKYRSFVDMDKGKCMYHCEREPTFRCIGILHCYKKGSAHKCLKLDNQTIGVKLQPESVVGMRCSQAQIVCKHGIYLGPA